jgi:PST family polysaccharide transporter
LNPPTDLGSEALAAADMAKLKRASISGAVANAVSQSAKLLIQLVSQAIMARILAPADYGLVAMAMPLIAFAMLFRDIGLSQATVQREQLDNEQSNSLFWINVAFSLALAAAAMAAAPLAHTLYSDARVALVVISLTPLLVMAGASAQHTALMNRHLRFASLAGIDLASTLAGAAVGIAAALAGCGYWSLIYMQLANSAVTLIATWAVSPWRPSRPKVTKSAIPLLKFGRNVTGFNLVNYFARNLDNILIGATYGAAKLAYYDRAYKLMTMPLGQVSAPFAKVAVPLLSRLQNSPEPYRQAYLKTLSAILLLTFPIGILGFAAGPRIILLVLGPAWGEAASIFQWLALGTLAAPIGASTGWLFLSQNRTREMFLTGVASSAIFIASFLIGLPWGPRGVAIAYVVFGYVLQGPYLLWRATRSGPVTLSDVLCEIAPFFAAGAVAALWLRLLEPSAPAGILGVVWLGLNAAAVLAPTLLLIPRSRRRLLGLAGDIRSLKTAS